MQLAPEPNSTRMRVETGNPEIGDLLLWVPEAVATNTGMCAVYPVGSWQSSPRELHQRIPSATRIGPGNCPRIDDATFECCGIRMPADHAVEWATTVRAQDDHVSFTMELTNLGDSPLRKAAAPICLNFLRAGWWSDASTWAPVNGQAVSLLQLGRDAGRPNGFQAYLLKNQTFDQVFYREFWGFSRHRLDRAILISEHRQADICVGIESDAAYFMHSNAGNPCTDMMLAFGDIGAGQSARASGAVWIRKGPPQQWIGNGR